MPYMVKRSRVAYYSTVNTPLGQITLSGYQRDSRGIALNDMRTFGKYAVVYLLNGSGRVKWGSHPPVPVRPGDLFFVYPEIPHGYAPGPHEFWSEFFIVFDGPVFDLWRRAGLLQPQNPIRHLPKIRHWLPRLEAVVAPGLPATTSGMLRRICRLQQFLGDIAQEPEVESAAAPWLPQALQLLLDSPENTPEAVARHLGLSYETFRKEFARQTGLPPARYRLHRRIDQARLLIAGQRLTNKQVAETLGFYDEFHFSRRFHEVTGQTTRAYRRGLPRPPAASQPVPFPKSG
jgi:AraC-like DNA-binding protein